MREQGVIVNEGGRFPLNGKITLPNVAGGKFPAVVLVHGSGGTDMDERVFSVAPFRDIAEFLAEKGIAVIRYDKRVFAHKGLRKTPYFSVKEETIEDAAAAANLIKSHPEVDANRVYILGHSMGGTLAPRIDAEGGDFAGLIMMAGTPRLFSEALWRQAVQQVKAVLKTPLFFLYPYGKWQLKKFKEDFAKCAALDDETASETPMWGPNEWIRAYWFKEFEAHPAVDYLAKTAKPMLILQGEKDWQVSAEEDFGEYKRLLGDRENVTFKLYPGLSHVFNSNAKHANTYKDYKIPAKTDTKVLNDIADWVLGSK